MTDEQTQPDQRGESPPEGGTEEKGYRSEAWVQKSMSDASFAGFQFWAVIGLVIILLITGLRGGQTPRSMYMLIVLFVATGCIGGCLISNRWGKKYGIPFLLIPALLLFAGIYYLPTALGMEDIKNWPQYQTMVLIREAMLKAEPSLASEKLNIFNLRHGVDAEGVNLDLIDMEIACADFFHCPETAKESTRGYWYALVKFDYDGLPFTRKQGRFVITAWPEVYKTTGRLIFMMDEKGAFYGIDLKDPDRQYIRTFPGPDPTEKGWHRFEIEAPH